MKKKVFLIIGILMIVIGVAVFSYPIIKTAISQHQNDQIMEEIKSEILDNLNKLDANPDVQIDRDEDDYFQELELDYQPESTEPSVLDSDRLNGHIPYGIIEIEKIDLVYAIVEGTDSWNIGVAIGHFPKSVAFGEEGNCALAGHRGGTSGPYFRDIDQLEPGDKVVCTNLKGEEFEYYVTGSMVVEPTDTYVVKDLGEPGRFLTLVTCTNHGTQRLVVRCKMQ